MIKRKGVIPNGGELLKTFGPKRTLALYKLKTTSKWLTLKLILAVGTAVKANYNMYWDGERMAGNDFIILSTHEPEIAQQVADYVKENFAELPVADVESAQRTSEGVPPEYGVPISLIPRIYGVDWRVYAVPTSSTNKGLKIVAEGRVIGRANYAVEWNGKRFIRNADFSRLAERIELLAAAEDFMENYVEEGDLTEKPASVRKPLEFKQTVKEYLSERDKMTSGKRAETQNTNIGTVGEVANLERDLIVCDIPEYPEHLEVRITAGQGTTTGSSFSAQLVEGVLVCEGSLTAALKNTPEVWATVEELLKQYFLEKSFN